MTRRTGRIIRRILQAGIGLSALTIFMVCGSAECGVLTGAHVAVGALASGVGLFCAWAVYGGTGKN